MKQAGTRTSIGLVAMIIVVLAAALSLASCVSTSEGSESTSRSSLSASEGTESTSKSLRETIETIEAKIAAVLDAIDPMRKYAPLSWNIDEALIVGPQGTTALWGTCGQCCIANTLNLVTGSTYTEADIVAFTLEQGLCVPETGGMTLEDMANAYVKLLPNDRMGVHGYGGDYAPTIDKLAARLEHGIILNVSVYGEMMREGGHTGEGEVESTHWIVLHSVDRADDGRVAGFGIVDSASNITYLTAQELSDIYYGHDGTTVIDPSCVQVYGLAV